MDAENVKNILLVEDNPDDEALTLRAFRKNNIVNQITVARDGVQALDYLFGLGQYAGRNVNELPVLMILDLKLPKLTGIDVLKTIRIDERLKLLPVVVLTSSNEEQDMIQSYSFGANSYVRKPVDFNEFMEAVQNLGIYWLVMNEPPPLLQNQY